MANTNQAQKRKQTRKRVVAVIAVVLLVLLCAVLYVRQRVQRSVTAQSSSNVKTASVTVGSIETAVSGTGTLVSENVEDLSVPSTVKVEEIFVEQGDEVEAGTLLASVNKSTVLTTLSTVQKKLDNLDADIHSASNNKVSSTINAGVPGRVKANSFFIFFIVSSSFLSLADPKTSWTYDSTHFAFLQYQNCKYFFFADNCFRSYTVYSRN